MLASEFSHKEACIAIGTALKQVCKIYLLVFTRGCMHIKQNTDGKNAS